MILIDLNATGWKAVIRTCRIFGGLRNFHTPGIWRGVHETAPEETDQIRLLHA